MEKEKSKNHIKLDNFVGAIVRRMIEEKRKKQEESNNVK
jgi:hypothetical protein